MVELQNQRASSNFFGNPFIKTFFENTHKVWTQGQIMNEYIIKKRYVKWARVRGIKGMMKYYSPKKWDITKVFFENYMPLKGEYLIELTGVYNLYTVSKGFYLCTNYRLLQKDGLTKNFILIPFDKLKDYKVEGRWSPKLFFKMNDESTIICEKVGAYLTPETINRFINAKEWLQYDIKPSENPP